MSNFDKEANRLLVESNLSRLYSWTRKHDYGIISASRYARDCGSGEQYTNKENKQRNKSLWFKLLAHKYGVTEVKGYYIEHYNTPRAIEVGESIFIVVDLNDTGDLCKELFSFGEEFEQDSILYGPAGEIKGDPSLIGTSKCKDSYPGYKIVSIFKHPLFSKTGQFMTKVSGLPFVFPDTVSEQVIRTRTYPRGYPTEIRSIVYGAREHWTKMHIL